MAIAIPVNTRDTESLVKSINYALTTLDLTAFNAKTREQLQAAINSAAKLDELLRNIYSPRALFDILFPVGSMYLTYTTGTKTPPAYGTWAEVRTDTGTGGAMIVFWRRTA